MVKGYLGALLTKYVPKIVNFLLHKFVSGGWKFVILLNN